MKIGYWYLLTLFELYLLHYLFLIIYRLYSKFKNKWIGEILTGGGIYLIIIVIYGQTNPEVVCWQNTLSMLQLVRYYPFFFVAVMLRKYSFVDMLFENQLLFLISLVSVISIVYGNIHNLHIYGRTFILPCVSLYVIFFLAKKLSGKEVWYIDLLDYVGKNTFDIYVFHYFIIGTTSLAFLVPVLTKYNSLVFSIVIILPIVLIVIALSVFIGKILRSSQIITRQLFFENR